MTSERNEEIEELQARVAQLEKTLATLTEALLNTQDTMQKRSSQLDGVTAVLIGVANTVTKSSELNEIGKTVVKAAIEGQLASSLGSNTTDAHIHGTSEWAYRLLPTSWKDAYLPE
ncbi:hypothetical protein [Acidovorax sp. Leaf84]|uniref:hypothetical protein n=1 Tax=Acidovorax sp. Leaf84 TaxID=1736240 RepID=UPI000A72E682|nr:hypothetical protein [Acidovorax sp. Leaf84]